MATLPLPRPPRTFTYLEVTANTAGTTVKTGPGHLYGIVINASAGTIRLFDNTAASVPAGQQAGIVGSAGAITFPAAGTLWRFDCDFTTGLFLVIASLAGSITLIYA